MAALLCNINPGSSHEHQRFLRLKKHFNYNTNTIYIAGIHANVS